MYKARIRYLRMQNVNGRVVVFGQVFHEDGTKLFPLRVVDAPLSQLVEFIDDDDDCSLENSYDVLSYLVTNGFGV